MPNRIFIGLAGKAQHGKSTLAQQLQSHFIKQGKTVATTSFAGTVKNMLLSMGLTWDQLYGASKEIPLEILGGKTPRFAMQTLATEWGRNMLFNEVWVKAWCNHVDTQLIWADVVIVEDLRHVPELEELQSRCAYIVQVVNPRKLPKTRSEKLQAWFKHLKAHSSEKLDFDKFDIQTVINEAHPTDMVKKFLEIHPELL